jgi:hypothetical protein
MRTGKVLKDSIAEDTARLRRRTVFKEVGGFV